MAAKRRKTSNTRHPETRTISCVPFVIIFILILVIIGLLVYIFTHLLADTPTEPDDPEIEHIERVIPDPDEDRPDIATGYVTDCLPVYYYDPMSQHFVPIHFPLENVDMSIERRARRIMERIIAGPPVGNLIRVVPEGTRLNSVRIEGDLALVDISKEIMDYGGSASERLIVQSILLSLTELREIERVQLLIDGEVEPYLPQGTSIEKPLIREGGPNSNMFVPSGKTAGYFYLIQKEGDFLTPIYWTWDGDPADPRTKIEVLYSEPAPQLSHGLASPAPAGLIIEKCEITNDVFTLIINRPHFTEAFRRHSPEKFLQATLLTMYDLKPFTKIDIRVGDLNESLPIWTYSAFARFEDMPMPPTCYNTFRGEVEPQY